MIVKELGEYILWENGEVKFVKTFVCVVSAVNIAYLWLFRLYVIRENASINCKIWEVARAIIAVLIFFKRMTIVDDERV